MKKKKKTAHEARRSHFSLQARLDALARMRAGETVSIHLTSSDTVRARALAEGEDPAHWLVLAILKKRLAADWCEAKGSGTGTRYRVGGRWVSRKDILGVVLYLNGKDAYEEMRGNAHLESLGIRPPTPHATSSTTSTT